MPELLTPQAHEFDANLIFTEYGLDPFFGCEAVIRRHDGYYETTIDFDGQKYDIELVYQDSGIGALNHPDADLETIREFRIRWQAQDDTGERSGTFHLAPRTPGLEAEDGSAISTPFDDTDLTGVNVRCQGSNLAFEKYPQLLRAAMSAVGVNGHYFNTVHEWSNIGDGEHYVRIDRDEAGRIFSHDGIIARLSNVLVDDRSGYRKHVADDTVAPGYYHVATIGKQRIKECFDLHRLPKEIKLYLPKHPDAHDPESPLYHPKLGVAYQRSLDEDTLHWSELERLDRELDEMLINVLEWADFPVFEDDIDDNSHSYVPDAYFEPGFSHRNRQLKADPTPALKAHQNSLVVQQLVDGLNDSDWDVLETLVSDGGHVAPKDIAADEEWHLNTIYRAIDRLEGLVEHHYNSLSLKSHQIAKRVTVAVQEARDAKEKAVDAAKSMAKQLEGRFERRLEEGILPGWLDEHDVELREHEEAPLKIDLGEIGLADHQELLQDGLAAWRFEGWDPSDWKNAIVIWKQNGRRNVLNQFRNGSVV